MVDENRHLPVIEDGLEDEAPACSPTNYVSNEEAALLASMRRLREKSMVVRRDLKDADPEDRARLEAEKQLDGLKSQLLVQKVEGFLVEKNTINIVEPKPAEEDKTEE